MSIAESFQPALAEALELLHRLNCEQPSSEEALACLEHLRRRHPALGLELVWERDLGARELHYDLMLSRPAVGTVALSWCPEGVLPFPLRGAQRAGDHVLVRVDGVALEVGEAMEALELLWHSVRLVDRVIDTCIVRAELLRHPIVVEEHMEKIAAEQLRLEKLRARLVGAAVPSRYEERPRDFDRVQLACFEVGDEAAALRARDQIAAGADFYATAQRTLLGAAGGSIQLAHCYRHELRLAAALQLVPGTTVTVRLRGRPFGVARIVAGAPAVLDEATREHIEQLLFDEWLAARRERAHVEWNWGTEPDAQKPRSEP
jgi:hypothetical protein